ncbi:helix-turn-helix domain-containing protein [Bacillus sp. ISL-40]|uniref:helix-turn-helix domain-containing protein n=1 Tax=unclassified Bacillus (in: firmicutes) TaxID=185979 RepID=UPI001BE6CBAF|nr:MULTISPECIES: helix-turn-helix domain-containing protein [unclassified Bacillus (in: firmicutes)]MBT2697244.1 helix-turn-helix domain-containing protein [Bacillus sp. ISL-40]MBT2741197.1 helix-turn-helix domain-containing protein [Bacillus sp. ISL-77]
MKQKVFDKTTTEWAAFIKYPLDLLQYRHHPNFKKGAETLFMMIAHYYNSEKGFAYPSMTLLAADCATTESTVDKHIKSLESLGLLKVVRRPKGNLYVPMQPLKREDFFIQYPEAKESYDKRYRKVEERREIREGYLAEIKSLHPNDSTQVGEVVEIEDLEF